MNPRSVLAGLILCSAAVTAGEAALRSPSVVGDLRLHEFSSRTFGNNRVLRVLVPPGYDDDANRSRRYPVLYLNDGQNLFDSATSIFNPMEWQVDETIAALIASREIPPIIVVGIDNAGKRGRFKEYFPWKDVFLRPPEPNPQGKRYPEFLVDEVMPFINARYRTLGDAANTGVGGSSAGGLAGMVAAIMRPGAIGRLLIESPSIYVDDSHVLRDAASVRTWPERIYLGVGTNEGGAATCPPDISTTHGLVHDVRSFERVLRAAGVSAERIRVIVEPCALHDEAAWARRLPAALRFLYGGH